MLVGWFLFLSPNNGFGQKLLGKLNVVYFGDTITIQTKLEYFDDLQKNLTEKEVLAFFAYTNNQNFQPVIDSLLNYKNKFALNDWLYYQLIRRTAEAICPKKSNFNYYTLYKWFLLVKSNYNAQLAFINKKLLLYVQSNDNVYDLPLFVINEKQYVCLNIHDFEKINFKENELKRVNIDLQTATKPFSYKIDYIPEFKEKYIKEKEVFFKYHRRMNTFKIAIDAQMEILFNNYPQVDFDYYFNIPLSKKTYNSLIPTLKKELKKKSQKAGVAYLMNFTRNAFLYETDEQNFGVEKRLSPEQTLMNKYSDCDDRVALFYYLVKEMYDLPMILLLYPTHVTIAVALQKPVGIPISYKGTLFTLCEPTPQKDDLPIGELMEAYKNIEYKIVYEYFPSKK